MPPKFKIKNVTLPVILLTALFLRLYKIKEIFPFDFDQQAPAFAAYDFFVNHKITLIGQELSFPGLFIGPLYNWIQFIPYRLCNLTPDCIPYFSIILGLLSIGLLFLVLKKIFNNKTALIVSSIYAFSFAAISYEIGINGNSFLFLSSIGLLFSLYQYFLGKNMYLVIGALIAGIATVNFNPVFIFSTATFFITGFFRKKRDPLIFMSGIFVFLLNYIPLVIFNFRHNNILATSLINFAHQESLKINYFSKTLFISRNIVLPFYSNFLFQNANLIFTIFTLLFILFALLLIFRRKNSFFPKFVSNLDFNQRFYFLFPLWIIIPILGLTFYKGHIPDYYFQQTLLAFIILVALAVRQNIIIFLIFTSAFLFFNLKTISNYHTVVNYQIKKEAVNFITYDSKGESFNVYYDMPQGLNTGYGYLFKVKGQEPQEGGKNLYILEFSDPHQFSLSKYFKSFPDKKITVMVIGFVHVVSVK